VGVCHSTWYVDVVSGVGDAPFEALRAFRQHLLFAGDNKECFGVVVAAKRDDGAGRDHPAHDTEVLVCIVWRCQEFDSRPEHIQSYVPRSFGDAVIKVTIVSLELHESLFLICTARVRYSALWKRTFLVLNGC